MAERRNYIALEWLTGEIEETLKQARTALEDFVADRDDVTKLRFCLTYAHQVHGSLKMLELHGAALLAAEIEMLSRALVNQRVDDVNIALEAMMTGLLTLSAHIQRINVTKDERPAGLLTVINELRAARGAEAHSEAAIFNPDLSTAPMPAEVEKPSIQHDEFNELARKIRQLYQTAMVSVIRDQQVDKACEILLKVLARIHKISHRTAAEPLWKIAHAVIQALAASKQPADNPAKTALRQIDNEIKKLAENGRDALEQRPSANLLKSLLYTVATAPQPTELVREIQKQYRLKDALPQTVASAGADVALPDAEAVKSVISAINEELSQIQDVLDLYSRGEASNQSKLNDLPPIFQRVIGTMSVLGASAALQIIREQSDRVKRLIAQPEDIQPDTLIEIASQIMAVQDVLRDSKNINDARSFNALKNQLTQAHATVMREARSGLEQAKESIIEYVASQWDARHLASVPALLEQMRGGLAMIPLPRAAAILVCCHGYIREQLLGQRVVPDWRMLDTLADAISSVEYYLECLAGDARADIEDILDVAEESVAELGYPVSKAAELAQQVHSVDASDEEDDEYRHWNPEDEAPVAATPVVTSIATMQDSSVQDTNEALGAESSEIEPIEAKSIDALSIDSESAAEDDHAAEVDASPMQVDAAPMQAAAPEAPATAAEEAPKAPAATDHDSDDIIDEEIVEIFVEEAAEVIAAINEHFPQWQATPDDRDVLIEIRRAFHTLKGSGRMVGAKDVGELAWSIENMLNRVLDGTHPANAPRMAMVEEAKDLAPAMVDAFHKQRKIDLTAAHNIQAMAQQLSQGVEPQIPTLSAIGVASTAASDDVSTGAEADAIIIDLPDVEPIAEQETSDSDDVVLRDIFRAEAISHLSVLRGFIDQSQHSAAEPIELSEPLQRALHTLKGSAHMAGATAIAAMITPVERLVKELRSFHVKADEDILAVLDGAVQFTEQGIALLNTSMSAELEGADEFCTEVERLHQRNLEKLGVTSSVVQPARQGNESVLLLVDGMEKLLHASDLLSQWSENSLPYEQVVQLRDDVCNLQRAAEGAGQPAIAALAGALGRVYQRVVDGELVTDATLFYHAQRAHESLIDMMDVLAAGQNVSQKINLVDALDALAMSAVDVEAEIDAEAEVAVTEIDVTDVDVTEAAEAEAVAAEVDAVADVTDDAIVIEYDEVEATSEPVESVEAPLEVAQVSGFVDDLDIVEHVEAVLPSEEEAAPFEEVTATSEAAEALHAGSDAIEFIIDESGIDESEAVEALAGELRDADVAAEAQSIDAELVADAEFVADSELVADAESGAATDTVALSDVLPESIDFESAEINSADASDEWMPEASDEIVVSVSETLAEEALAEEASAEETSVEETSIEEPWIASLEDDAVAVDSDEITIDFDSLETPTMTTEVEAASNDDRLVGDVQDADELEAEATEQAAEMVSDSVELAWAQEHGVPESEADMSTTELAAFAGIDLDVPKVEVTPSEIIEGSIDELMSAGTDEPSSNEFTVAREPVRIDIKPVVAAVGSDAEKRLAVMLDSIDPETLEVFLEEAADLMESIDESSHAWIADHDNTVHAEALKRYLHTLKGGARLAGITPLGDFTHDYETFLEAARAFDNAFFRRLEYFQDRLHSMLEAVLSGDAASLSVPVQMPEFETSDEVSLELPVAVHADVVDDEFDAEVLEIFFEEARDLQEAIDTAIAAWRNNLSDTQQLEELKRLLHTLKGGARLAGQRNIGNLSHNFETYLITAEQRGEAGNDECFATLQGYQDQLVVMVDEVATRLQGKAAAAVEPVATFTLPDDVASAMAEPAGDATDADATAVEAMGVDAGGAEETGSNVVPFRRPVEPIASTELPELPQVTISQAAIDATRSFVEQFERGQQRGRGAQEVVKVAAQLLEDLVNLAGETSISRSRVEEQMSEMSFSVDELDMTIDRLKGQLRRLEIETDAQIAYRQEQLEVIGAEGFDPLEMDRYSHLQQLSRSLIESASDLQDLRDTFTNKIRDIETLLLQQSRVNTELQEGLMRSQMVPFARMVPRLRRIVRQVASELGKQVDLIIENDEGELDRTVLERMVAPLEHMLRNAVDHGIETIDERRALGKPSLGTITLSLGREGGDVLLNLSDDGGGIDLDAVRNKAIERGLMTHESDLTHHEVLQFILHAGFSTAKKVTQISGRGVGMDVVHSEIKQLGGSMDISSVRGSGTQFTVRLPFTVSVNRALMVCIGTDTYAIPLNTIEGIVRVSPYELEAYYQPNAPQFEYAGQSYTMRYIGSLLGMDARPKLEGQTMPLPVVLIRGGDHAVAVQVDRLLGSREVVVKTLGPQFSMVDGLSGATVLGDGSVVVILDLHAMIRADISRAHRQHLLEESAYEREVQRVLHVMVIDDSVTVRKVTTRLLERLGIEVSTAKDGVEAVAKLNEAEVLPDVMLLDIEMPRMDGFEVASRVRHTGRLQHIPIIMITSRTGEKHRERALSLGVNKYMGKPYQESELLDAISALTSFEIAR